MKLISPLDHPHSGKAAILIAIALVLGITVHEVFFLIALLIAAIACIEWGAHEVHVIHERKTHSQRQPASLAMRVALHPFLTGISRTHLALLADCAIATHFEKRQTILREGEFAKGVYLIESGKVVLESCEESGEPVVVDTIGPGIRLAVRGCSRRTSGGSPRARSNPLTPSFSMGQLCANIAKRTTR